MPDNTKKLAAIIHDVISEILLDDDATIKNLNILKDACQVIIGSDTDTSYIRAAKLDD